MQKYDIRRPASEQGDFEERYWSPVNYPVLDESGELIYIIHRVEDVTDFVHLKLFEQQQQKETEELQVENERMEQEIFLRAQEIQEHTRQIEAFNQQLEQINNELLKARDQAIEASNIKSAFVANISHELRTPLAGVIELNELLLETELTAEQKELMTAAQDGAQSLLAIVNDLLDISKIEAGKTELESIPFNIAEQVNDIAKLLSSSARNKGLNLETIIAENIPPSVVGDPTRLRQVLLNLIGNGIKFTEKGGVSVRATVAQQAADRASIYFSVTDTGIGIAPEEHRFLFQPFSQVDNSNTRRYGGTGLGLSITKRLVKMMGGEIGIESEKNKGSTFWFQIDFNLASTMPTKSDEHRQPIADRIPGNKLVLVAEDNPLIQLAAAKQLNNLGVQVHTANNGRSALASIANFNYDLILMDCQMPEMDGLEATSTLRKMEAGSQLHRIVIAMTAAAMPGDKEKCLAGGMDDYLSKPFSNEQLREKLVKWLA